MFMIFGPSEHDHDPKNDFFLVIGFVKADRVATRDQIALKPFRTIERSRKQEQNA